MPTPRVGKRKQASMPCRSSTSTRASGSRYSGWMGSSSPNAPRMSSAGERPRKYSSRQPGRATGSNSGFGMNRLSFPATIRRGLPFTSAHCMPRLAMPGSRWRVKASGAS